MNLKQVKLFLSKNSPIILACMGVFGTVSTVYTAHQDTLKAEHVKKHTRPRNWKEEIHDTWKCYIPTAISATGTIGCIVGSHYCSSRQREALASAYLVSQTTLQKYQEKVIERIGKNKARDLREEVDHEMAEFKAPAANFVSQLTDAIDTGHGKTLFYDVPGERYFYSDLNYMDKQVNDMNREVRTEMYFDWNEINYRWGLPYKKFGSEHIFTPDDPLEVRYKPEFMDNGQVRILVNYELIPLSEWKERNR